MPSVVANQLRIDYTVFSEFDLDMNGYAVFMREISWRSMLQMLNICFLPYFAITPLTFLHFGRGKCVGQAACLLARIETAETV